MKTKLSFSDWFTLILFGLFAVVITIGLCTMPKENPYPKTGFTYITIDGKSVLVK